MPSRPAKPLVKFENGVLEVQIRRLWQSYPASAIKRIVGFKRDFVTLDVIYWELEFDDGSRIHIHEDVEGFKDATAGLMSALGIPDALVALVTYPPFEENRTVLFERGGELRIED